ncbi:MAG: hypothetical protein DBX45_01480 [Oscillospiraceae bacterium]|jgi:singapore isolate B (sub-type 7) whole genome shotgun sequence assembly, scaffold_19|nr:MAG: hypothetical protein DBX45_01480 [Oscillospiraceae bacterium]
MYQNCLLLESKALLSQLLPEGALLQVITRSPIPEPEPSPESDTVNKESNDSSTLQDATSVPNAKFTYLPILTNPKRILIPSLAELKELSEEELGHVEKVSIKEPGIGCIEWEEPVDLRGLDLDTLISFDVEDGYPSVSVCM